MAEHVDPPSEAFTLVFPEGADGLRTLEASFDRSRMAMCVTDPTHPENPIVYVNDAFEALTGYRSREVIGRNCRFLQGKETDPAARAELRVAIAAKRTCILEILNFRKNGEPFWNALHIGPIFDQTGRLRYFFGSQWDVTEIHGARAQEGSRPLLEAEIGKRIGNLFSVLGSIVATSAQGLPTPSVAALRARERIVALGRAYEKDETDNASASAARLSDLVDRVLSPYRVRAFCPVEAGGDEVVLQIGAITPVGLILHELAANSVAHGSLGGHGSALFIDWQRVGGGRDAKLRLTWRDKSAIADRTTALGRAGVGSKIIDAMIRSFDGNWTGRIRAGAYEAVVELPADAALAPHIHPGQNMRLPSTLDISIS